MTPLQRHLVAQAVHNAWANHRLLRACALLTPAEFAATRTSYFPSIKATLNHKLTVDWYYLDALERARHGQPPHPQPDRFFDPPQPCPTCSELAREQQATDRRLVDLCRSLPADPAALRVAVPRRDGIHDEAADRLLAHLFQHQIHHRGQAHAMLAGTPVPPPQLDEFFCAHEAHLRAADLAALGFTEAELWAG